MKPFPFVKCLLFSILIVLLQHLSFSQNYNAYKKYEYHWKEEKPVQIAVNKNFLKEDVIYLDDQNIISIGSQKESDLLVSFQRKVRMKFLTPKGVEKFHTITIPESLDPLYDYHETPFKNNSIKKSPPYFNVQLNYFAARIIKQDGRIISPEFTDVYNEEDVLSMIFKLEVTYKYFKSHYWNFIFKNIEPGDELEYDYQIEVPYKDNFYRFNSVRVFFNGEEPRQNYSLQFRHSISSVNPLTFINGSEPDSSNIVDKTKTYYWTKKDLYGCLDEPNARPYLTLPYLIYTVNQESLDYLYSDAVSAEKKYMPPWLYFLRVRESKDFDIHKRAANKLYGRQDNLFNEFIKQTTAGIADSLKYTRFIKIHSLIADSFKYVYDEALFREKDISSEGFGDLVSERKIREISRYTLYSKILTNCKLDYFSLFMMDNRYGKIDTNYTSPLWNNEYLFAIYLNGSFAFAHPKKSNFGLYIEELPFYWENTSGLLINYSDLYYDFPEKPRILKTTLSNLNDNTRMCNVMVNADLDNLTTTFEAKVSLTGQYSTLTRFLYLGDAIDSIDNPLYNKKISDIDGHVKIKAKEITGRKNIFPYKFDVRTSYDVSEILNKKDEGIAALNMKGWFNHIIYDYLQTENRQLDFYPDFVGQDIYRYMIKFNKPVEIKEGTQVVDLTNSFGKLSIKYSQPQPDEILIESFFVTTAEKVSSEKIKDITDIYNAIANLNSSSIQLKY